MKWNLPLIVMALTFILPLSCCGGGHQTHSESCDAYEDSVVANHRTDLADTAPSQNQATPQIYSKDVVDSLVALIDKRCLEIAVLRKRYLGCSVINNPQQIEVIMENLSEDSWEVFHSEVTNHPLVSVRGGVDYCILEEIDSDRIKTEIEEMIQEMEFEDVSLPVDTTPKDF